MYMPPLLQFRHRNIEDIEDKIRRSRRKITIHHHSGCPGASASSAIVEMARFARRVLEEPAGFL
jgi:hypothetical protein